MRSYMRYKKCYKWVQRPTTTFRVEAMLQNALQITLSRSCEIPIAPSCSYNQDTYNAHHSFLSCSPSKFKLSRMSNSNIRQLPRLATSHQSHLRNISTPRHEFSRIHSVPYSYHTCNHLCHHCHSLWASLEKVKNHSDSLPVNRRRGIFAAIF